jgi:hypothetical protein
MIKKKKLISLQNFIAWTAAKAFAKIASAKRFFVAHARRLEGNMFFIFLKILVLPSFVFVFFFFFFFFFFLVAIS